MKRKNEKMKWVKCKKCGSRIYKHREDSHICDTIMHVHRIEKEVKEQ